MSKPSAREDAYFAQQHAEQLRGQAEKKEKDKETNAFQEQRCLGCGKHMTAVIDSGKMKKCPLCGGVWLAKGVLEEMLQEERFRFWPFK